MSIYNSNGTHEKTHHIFIVTFQERFFDIPGTTPSMWDTHYIKYNDIVPVNIYGLKDAAAAEKFDPSILKNYLIGVRNRTFHWPAENKNLLLAEIAADADIKAGSMWLAPESENVREVIQDLPECSRMYTHTKSGTIVCGKPTNTFGDGCLGGCILQGGNQEFEEGECPLKTFWDKQLERKKVAVS